METVTLESSDGKIIIIPVEVANMIITVKHMLDDLGGTTDSDNAIPLPNVRAEILEKVIEFCKHHHERHDTTNTTADTTNTTADTSSGDGDSDDKESTTIDENDDWNTKFCEVEQSVLFELILAANYLDIKPLLELTCKTVANMIKGKTPEEICEVFGTTYNFTPEEEEQLVKDHPWCVDL